MNIPSPLFLSHTPGVLTGTCLKAENEDKGQCEIEGWCPPEQEKGSM